MALTTAQAMDYLKSGDPVVKVGGGPGGNSVSMTSFMLKPGEERLIAWRMKEIFKAHKA